VIYEWPSITLFAVLAHVILRRGFGRPLFSSFERRTLFTFAAVLGIVLTITTIGSPAVNVYALGFSGFAPLVLAVVAALLARRAPAVAVLALVILVAFDLHLYRSRNLFDYLIDPFIALACWGWCVVALWRRMSSLRRSHI
jgi:hypothetical protein